VATLLPTLEAPVAAREETPERAARRVLAALGARPHP
jgi:hypothetical protein